MKTQLTLEIIRAIIKQAEEHSRLAKRHYNAALTIAFLSICFSFATLGATAKGKLSDKAIGALSGSLPFALCVQLINNAGKQLQAASQQLNQTLDNLDDPES